MDGLFQEMNALIDGHLGLARANGVQPARFQLASSLLVLSQAATDSRENLVDLLFTQAQKNWDGVDEETRGRSSSQNWRSAKRSLPAVPAHSLTTLLNQVIAACADDRWSNRVPVDSGLLGSCGRRKVALAERGESDCSLIELTTTENTPLAMAIRGMQHCVAYLFFRRWLAEVGHPDWANQGPPELLRAERLSSTILAPRSYYARFERSLHWLQEFEGTLNRDLEHSNVCRETQIPVGFYFETFPDDFEWTAPMADSSSGRAEALAAFAGRQRLFAA